MKNTLGVPAVQPQQEKNMELPDAIRVPLDELEADAAYIIGRVAADGSCSGVMVEAIRRRTRAVREALLAHGVGEAPAPNNDDPILRALCKGFVLAEAYGEEADCKLFHEAEKLYRASGVGGTDVAS